MKFYLFLLVVLIMSTRLQSQEVINLYNGTPPNNITTTAGAKQGGKKETYVANQGGIGVVSNVTQPTLTVYTAKKPNATRTSVIIFPGGGYSILAIDHEGYDVAKAFNDMGVTAFVLKYRLPDSSVMTNPAFVPLMDAQEAIKMVKTNANKWNIDPEKVGILGFSAGGHLASTAGTHFNSPVRKDDNASVSLRPAFMVLIYPVISFNDSITHKGSKERLIGKTPLAESVGLFSNESQVTKETPPAFLVHAADDKAVPVENSLRFFEALLKNGVAAEMHVYQNGGHGFGMINKTTNEQWMHRLQNWFLANKLLK